MSTTELPQPISRYIAACNERNWTAIPPCYAADAEFLLQGSVVAKGNDEIAATLQANMESMPETHDEVVRVTVSGTMALVEMVFSGNTPDGTRFEAAAADIFELTPDGSEIARVSAWFDGTHAP
ncbi:nuclear transport factor 2 family protein [Streptomyces sp. NPDC050560]|uniref:nuclear transport factor 2 family protein n=1 Tax=Streptomyces sp. NPDC050560 TaxID=3365630 RepID=UPI0037A72294